MAHPAVDRVRWGDTDPAALEVLRQLRGARRARRRPARRTRERLAQPWPAAVERRYVKILTGRVGLLEAATLDQLEPLIRLQFDASDVVRQDAEFGTLIKAIGSVRALVSAGPRFEVLTNGIRALARQLDLFTGRKVEQVVGRIPTVPANLTQARVAGDLDQWTREQVARIRTIDARYFDDLEAAIKEAIAEGTRSNDLRDLIRGRIPQEHRGRTSAEYNARRIARDQLGSLNGKLTRQRYAGAGVARYRWRTSKDEAVREAHRELEGRIFDVGGPGAVGAGVFGQDIHPGDDIQCRCRAVPIFDDDEEGATSPSAPVQTVEEAIEARRAQLVATYGEAFVRELDRKAARRGRRR